LQLEVQDEQDVLAGLESSFLHPGIIMPYPIIAKAGIAIFESEETNDRLLIGFVSDLFEALFDFSVLSIFNPQL
jgi:hypothetical protein